MAKKIFVTDIKRPVRESVDSSSLTATNRMLSPGYVVTVTHKKKKAKKTK